MSSPDAESGFRDFASPGRASVQGLYEANHARQTLDFVLAKKAEYLPLRRTRMGVWEAIEALEGIVDDSDPDTGLSQLQHALQTAEALRAEGSPRWLVLTGFVHDLGKVLCLFDEPQWAVVGDTFPVGCAFSLRVVYPELFAANPDATHHDRASELGVYTPGCGLDAIHFSWGHDEYLYHVMRGHLPSEALDVIRYHSFYAGHADGAYRHLLAPGDAERLERVHAFSRFDLYSKDAEPISLDRHRAYYEDLVRELLPDTLQW